MNTSQSHTHVDISEAENKAISKQLVMNHIHLPEDVIKNVQTFLFYDKDIYNRKKQFSAGLTNQIARLVRSEGGGRQYYPGHWAIYYEEPDLDLDLDSKSNIDFQNYEDMANFYKNHSFQLQGVNCMKCGNYLFHNGLYEMNISNTHLYCHCPEEEEEE